MSELKDKIKKLISKAKDSGDVDLLELAMDLLDEIPVPEATTIAGPSLDRSKLPSKFSEFTAPSSRRLEKDEAPARVNQFVDRGVEHKDLANATPDIPLTERRRGAFKMSDVTCSECGNKSQVHPQHYRDNFMCEKCLRRK